ncbi:hypothetical protein GCM10022255_094580 [Dactylosporangium darangshiense]|uniref:Uncharacterized protein n=1 Tax=Dactylosporangium darangshiense TaxID=579108 RepID=A0ABP8DQA0_9ACTN
MSLTVPACRTSDRAPAASTSPRRSSTPLASADSDLECYDHNTGGYHAHGSTECATVAGGHDVTRDAGVL